MRPAAVSTNATTHKMPPIASSLNSNKNDNVNKNSNFKQQKLQRPDRALNVRFQRLQKRSEHQQQQHSSREGFHPFMQSSQSIEFLSTFNFSDTIDGSQDRNTIAEDQTPIVPVTEMSDLELKRLGFPVPATTTESNVYSILHGFGGSGHDLSSVIDSPYIKFTSRKYCDVTIASL